MPRLTKRQVENLKTKKKEYYTRPKRPRIMTQADIVLKVIEDEPDRWWFTWELIGSTAWGWLSHTTHATLRVLEQQGKIQKDYIGRYVVYTAIQDITLEACCLCQKELDDEVGHNALPLMEGRCCSKCNTDKVVPARMKLAQLEKRLNA